jgi:hypothetical protein
MSFIDRGCPWTTDYLARPGNGLGITVLTEDAIKKSSIFDST